MAVYESADIASQAFVEALLRDNGIPCLIRRRDALSHQHNSPSWFAPPLQLPQIFVATASAERANELIQHWISQVGSLETPLELQDQELPEPPAAPPEPIAPSNRRIVPLLLIAVVIGSMVGYSRGLVSGWVAVVAALACWATLYLWIVIPRREALIARRNLRDLRSSRRADVDLSSEARSDGRAFLVAMSCLAIVCVTTAMFDSALSQLIALLLGVAMLIAVVRAFRGGRRDDAK